MNKITMNTVLTTLILAGVSFCFTTSAVAEGYLPIQGSSSGPAIVLNKIGVSPDKPAKLLYCDFSVGLQDTKGTAVGIVIKDRVVLSKLSVNAFALHGYLCSSCVANQTYWLITRAKNCSDNAFLPVTSFSTSLSTFTTNGNDAFTLKQRLQFSADFKSFELLDPSRGTINFTVSRKQ